MPTRPEAGRNPRGGFQRRVDEQRYRYAAQLAHADQLAAHFECGEVAGVYGARAPGDEGAAGRARATERSARR